MSTPQWPSATTCWRMSSRSCTGRVPMTVDGWCSRAGTALRLIHLRHYRYSADLDFTVVGGGLERSLAALSRAVEAARVYAGFPMLELSTEGTGLDYIGPLGSGRPRRVKVDMATDEYVESVTQATVLDGIWTDLPAAEPFDVYRSTRSRRRNFGASSRGSSAEISTTCSDLPMTWACPTPRSGRCSNARRTPKGSTPQPSRRVLRTALTATANAGTPR